MYGSFYAFNLEQALIESTLVYPAADSSGPQSSRVWFGCNSGRTSNNTSVRYSDFTTVADASDITWQRDWKIAWGFGAMHSWNVFKNTFRVVFEPTTNQTQARGIYWMDIASSRFRGNKWIFDDSTTGGCLSGDPSQRIRIRDRARGLQFDVDTFVVRGNCGAIMLSSQVDVAQGISLARWRQGGNSFDSCYFDFQSQTYPSDYGPIRFHWGMQRDAITNSVFLMTGAGPCLVVDQVHSRDTTTITNHLDPNYHGPPRPGWNRLEHNMFYSTGASSSGAILFQPARGSYGTWTDSAKVSVSRNIIDMRNWGILGTTTAGYYEVFSGNGREFVADYNLYFYGPAMPGDSLRAVKFRSGCTGAGHAGCSAEQVSKVGGTSAPWFVSTGSDPNSRFGDPHYVYAWPPLYNPDLQPYSPARFGPDGYVGRGRLCRVGVVAVSQMGARILFGLSTLRAELGCGS